MTQWTVAHQTPLSIGFLRQEYWSGLPFPSPEDLPHLGIELESPTLQADSLLFEPPGKSSLSVGELINKLWYNPLMGFPGGKECLPMQETWVPSQGGEDLLEEEMQTTPVFLLGKSHGQRSLEGYSPRSHKELDMT